MEAASMPSAKKDDDMILQDMLQVSLAKHKSHEEQEARENVALVYEHLTDEEIEKLVENTENVDDNSPYRHDDTSIPGTRLEPRSDKESPEVEFVQEKEEETTKDTKKNEIFDEVFELRRRAKGKNVEETMISSNPSPTRSPRNLYTLVSSDTEKLQELTVTHPIPSSGSSAPKLTKTNRLLSLIKNKVFMPRTSSDQLADNLHDVMMETLPSLVKEKVTEQVKKEVPAQVRDQVPITPLVQSCQRDPEAPALSLINQDLLYLKKKADPHAKDLLQKETEEPRRPDGEESIQLYDRFKSARLTGNWPDYKNLNKNDIEDMYLLIVNNKVPDYANTGLLWSLSVFIRSSVIWERVHDFQLGIESYQQKINLTAPTITFPRIKEYDVFSIVYEPVHGIIYTNSKKEKRVMRHSEIHKFCDATLRRMLEGLKSYYNDVKYGYVQKELTNDEVEFLKLFEEEIEV
ncbi:hypothetical protein Tco_1459026 [Tanacetum coccineum]